MTALPVSTGTELVLLPSPRPASQPVAWDAELQGAQYLLKSGLCPVALKTPEAVLFVVLAGRDLGLSPVASLRGLTVIQGKIEVSADLQLGLFHRAGGKSQWVELTEGSAVLQLTAPWMTALHRSSFTMADATRAGLNDGNYKKYPKAMLRSRAITQGLKDIGFDATAGCYAPGEIGGPVDVETETSVGADASPINPDRPTDKQRALLDKLLSSSVWAPHEVAKVLAWAGTATKAQLTERIDACMTEMAKRKATQAVDAAVTA